MSTNSSTKTAISQQVDPKLLSRIIEEGYGPGAWHGPDLQAALADVSADLAFWRPAAGRHNIAEIALHHAFGARSVRGQLSAVAPEPFILKGEDWFELKKDGTLSWPQIQAAVLNQQQRLAAAIADSAAGSSPLSDAQRFELVLGITCHAIYHAGQIQLIKRLHPK
jgi:DinB superfamily